MIVLLSLLAWLLLERCLLLTAIYMLDGLSRALWLAQASILSHLRSGLHEQTICSSLGLLSTGNRLGLNLRLDNLRVDCVLLG